MESVPSPSPFLNLTVVLRGLRGALGGFCARGVLGHALALILWARLSGVCLRMERLAGRFLAGRVRRVVGRVPLCVAACDGAGGDGAGGDRAGRAAVFPARFAWLVRQVGWQASGYGSQLRAVLQTPEMVALLEACPQAGRMLRPICRMLAVETSVLRLPAPAKRVAVARGDVQAAASAGAGVGAGGVGRTRVRVVAAPWRIPLPRGVLAAARRQGFGKIPYENG